MILARFQSIFLFLTLTSGRPNNSVNCAIMAEEKGKYGFWTKYKRYAGNEILLYIIMIIGIILGIIIFS